MAGIVAFAMGLVRNPGSALGLLKNPFVIGLALLAWTAYQRHDAASTARAACENVQLRADMAELARQLAARDRLLKETTARADATESEIEKLEKDRDGILAELAALAPPAADGEPVAPKCTYPAGIAKRLREIS